MDAPDIRSVLIQIEPALSRMSTLDRLNVGATILATVITQCRGTVSERLELLDGIFAQMREQLSKPDEREN
jgi:hypothetical protein